MPLAPLPPATSEQLRLAAWLLGASHTEARPSKGRLRVRVEQEGGAWIDLDRPLSTREEPVETVILGGHRALREGLRQVLAAVIAEGWRDLEATGATGPRATWLRLLLAVEAAHEDLPGAVWHKPQGELSLGLWWVPRAAGSVDRVLLQLARQAWGAGVPRLGPLGLVSHPREPLEPEALAEELRLWLPDPPESLDELVPAEVEAAWRLELSWDARWWVWAQGVRWGVAWWETSA